MIHAGLREDLATGAGDETLPPEFDALASIRGFVADAVRDGDEAAVGHRVRALDGLPRAVLVHAVFLFLLWMPADGGGVEENLRASHRREPRAFGIPLVPADQHSDLPELRLPRTETEVSGREIKFLVVQRVVRDVHLAVDSQELAARVDDRRGVVIKTRRAALEERRDDHDVMLLGQLLERLRGRPRNRLGEVEVFVVLDLAEILRAEKFLRADDLRSEEHT